MFKNKADQFFFQILIKKTENSCLWQSVEEFNRKPSMLLHMHETNAAIATITANGFINQLLPMFPFYIPWKWFKNRKDEI